jgi:hypothetical protein
VSDLDVNGSRLGELVGFPSAERWSSLGAMLQVLDDCRRLYADMATFEAVDRFWRSAHARDRCLA